MEAIPLPRSIRPVATTILGHANYLIEVAMFLAIIAVIILIMKIADINPVANWSWFYVLLPFALLAFWWEFVSKWIGWDKRNAEKKMAADMKKAAETKKKNRGF